MRPSFLKLPQPYLAAIVVEATANACIANIRNSEHEGAQGFMLDLTALPCLTFGIREYSELAFGIQPTVRSAHLVLHELTWHTDR